MTLAFRFADPRARQAPTADHAVRAAFERAIAVLVAGVTLAALTRAIGRERQSVAALFDWPGFHAELLAGLSAALLPLLRAAALGAGAPDDETLAPALRRFLGTELGPVVHQIVETTRQGLSETLADPGVRQESPAAQARLVLAVAGLDARRAAAAVRYRAALLTPAVGPSRPQAQVEQLTDAYADRAHDDRAEMVATTETVRATQHGRRIGWVLLLALGAVGAARLHHRTRQRWDAQANACPRCASLDGTVVGLDEPFDAGIDAPPLHPYCRCEISLVR